MIEAFSLNILEPVRLQYKDELELGRHKSWNSCYQKISFCINNQ
jgi:hypothetical protein